MDIAEIKRKICSEIDRNRDKIIEIGDTIYGHPELGYKELKTTELAYTTMKELGLEPEKNIAVTGCRGILKGGKPGPAICFMGELDAIPSPEHKDADPETGAVHACGHNVQVAVMLGAAMGIVKSGVFSEFSGSVHFTGVPAEEFIELAFRSSLKEQGKITYFGGKQELIKRGLLDDVDIVMMMHVLHLPEGKDFLIGPRGNGFIGKEIRFIGREAHAGSAPEEGINALNAATLAMNNIHAQRETFYDQDRIRVHPIITKGGDIVNVVPSDVRMESYVRGRTIKGLLDANKKVDRALKAGAMAVGAEVFIRDIPGYLPLLDNGDLDDILRENVKDISGPDSIVEGADFTGSFDFGDVSHLKPAIHPMIGGITGGLHAREYRIVDKEKAYIQPTKALAMTVADLLYGNAEKAKKVMDNFKPLMTKEDYLKYMESVSRETSFKAPDSKRSALPGLPGQGFQLGIGEDPRAVAVIPAYGQGVVPQRLYLYHLDVCRNICNLQNFLSRVFIHTEGTFAVAAQVNRSDLPFPAISPFKQDIFFLLGDLGRLYLFCPASAQGSESIQNKTAVQVVAFVVFHVPAPLDFQRNPGQGFQPKAFPR